MHTHHENDTNWGSLACSESAGDPLLECRECGNGPDGRLMPALVEGNEAGGWREGLVNDKAVKNPRDAWPRQSDREQRAYGRTA